MLLSLWVHTDKVGLNDCVVLLEGECPRQWLLERAETALGVCVTAFGRLSIPIGRIVNTNQFTHFHSGILSHREL